MSTTHGRTLPKRNTSIGSKICFPAPNNVTFAFVAYNERDEAVYEQALDDINAGEALLPMYLHYKAMQQVPLMRRLSHLHLLL